MNKKVNKTALIFLFALIGTLVIPIIGKWYQQKFNIEPFSFYITSVLGGIVMICFRMWSIWGQQEEKEGLI